MTGQAQAPVRVGLMVLVIMCTLATAAKQGSVQLNEKGDLILKAADQGRIMFNQTDVLGLLQSFAATQAQLFVDNARLEAVVKRLRWQQPQLPSVFVVVAGGDSSAGAQASMDRFDGTRWSEAPPMRMARANAALAPYTIGINKYLFAVGGLREESALGTVEAFDGVEWRASKSLTSKREGHGAAAYRVKGKEHLVVVGGHDGTSYLNAVEMFDGVEWKAVAPMSTARYHHGVVVYQDRLFAVGGRGADRVGYKTVESFDGTGWTAAAPMSTIRSHLAVAVYPMGAKQFLVAAGGRDPRRNDYWSTAEKFDGKRWTPMAPMKYDRHGLGLAVFSVDGKAWLLAMGGYNSDGYLSIVEKFDGVEWEEVGHMPSRRYSAGVAVF